MFDTEKNYALFKKYLKAYIKRDGIDRFIEYLDTTDFAQAPASTKYHLCWEGGLCKHSLNVFTRLYKLLTFEYPSRLVTDESGEVVLDEQGQPKVESTIPYSKETIAFVGLLHDISKAEIYTKQYKNVQNKETGKWESKSYWTMKDSNDRLFFGSHEENSVFILNKFFKLTDDEAIAIRYHMGVLEAGEAFPTRVLQAYKSSPLALLLHTADLMAMCLDETEVDMTAEPNEKKDESTNKAAT